MHPEGWKPFADKLRSPWNIVLIACGLSLCIDYVLDSPVMSHIVAAQVKIMGVNPDATPVRIYTIVGTFTSMTSWTRFLERSLIVLFLAFPACSFLSGFWTALRGK